MRSPSVGTEVWLGLERSTSVGSIKGYYTHFFSQLPNIRVEVEKSDSREVIVIEMGIQRVAIVYTRVQGLVDPVQNGKRSGKTF